MIDEAWTAFENRNASYVELTESEEAIRLKLLYVAGRGGAAANLLAGPLKAGEVRTSDLRAVQRRRLLPTRIVQAFQSVIQRRFVAQALGSTKPVTPPAFLRFPVLRRLAARFIAFGVWPVHVKD